MRRASQETCRAPQKARRAPQEWDFFFLGLSALRFEYLSCKALLPPMMKSLQISAARCAAMPLPRSARADRIGALTVMVEQTRATSRGKPYTSAQRLAK